MAYERSFQARIHLRGKPCRLRRHFRGCTRQVVGYLELLAAHDEKGFCWPGVADIQTHALRWEADPHGKTQFSLRQVQRALRNLERLRLITRGSIWVDGRKIHGWQVTKHSTSAEKAVCKFVMPVSEPERPAPKPEMSASKHVMSPLMSPLMSPPSAFDVTPCGGGETLEEHELQADTCEAKPDAGGSLPALTLKALNPEQCNLLPRARTERSPLEPLAREKRSLAGGQNPSRQEVQTSNLRLNQLIAKTTMSGPSTTHSSKRKSSWSALGIRPMGSRGFQVSWENAFQEAAEGETAREVCARFIARCNTLGLPVPVEFRQAVEKNR